MKKKTRNALLIAFLFFGDNPFGIAQSFCCDPDAVDFSGNGVQCGQEDGGFLPDDDVVCDADCSGYDGSAPECTTIPLDGGLSLLALAGGGLATAAIRRRREEEEAAQEAA